MFPGLDSLVDLADAGVDIRPTLLRVLTDLYVQQQTHSIEEEQQYCELAQRLLGAVDVATRAAVAAKLASYPAAPLQVLKRLREDTVTVRDALRTAARAPRGGIPSGQDRMAANSGPADAAELTALFAAAAAEERRLILLNLDVAAPQPCADIAAAPSAVAALEALALQRRTEEFVKGLGRLLAIADEQARAIVQDSGGEPFVAAAKALGVPGDVLQRVLLFLNPAIGHSVERVYDLAQLYDEVPLAAAHALVSIWQAAHPRVKRPVGHATASSRRTQDEGQRTNERPVLRPASSLRAQATTVSRK